MVSTQEGQGGGTVTPDPEPEPEPGPTEPAYNEEYTDIAMLKADAAAEKNAVKFNTTDLLITGVAKSGKNTSVYATDGTNGILFYSANETTLQKGDKVSGPLYGNLCLYNGLTEVSEADFSHLTVASQGNEVVPVEATIAQINADQKKYENLYVRLTEVSFGAEAIASRNITMSQGEDQTTLRDNWNILTDYAFSTTKTYTVCAFVAIYKTNAQLYPMTTDDLQVNSSQQPAEAAWSTEKEVFQTLQGAESQATFTTTSDGQVSYSSSNEAVATIDAQGKITVVGCGLTTITAEVAETDNYTAARASFKLGVVEGQGTLASAYTAADVQILCGTIDAEAQVWVRGTVLGYATSGTQYITEGEKVGKTNLMVGQEDCFVPVQLPTSPEAIRIDLNLVDNSYLIGKQIYLLGNITEYFKVPGVKNVCDYSFDGESQVVGIESAALATKAAKAVYDLTGRRVSDEARGVLIIDGKKVIR